MADSLLDELTAKLSDEIDAIEQRIAPDLAELDRLRDARERLTGSPSKASRRTSGSRRNGGTNSDRILATLRAEGPLRASELQSKTGISSTYQLLRKLQDENAVKKDEATKTYSGAA